MSRKRKPESDEDLLKRQEVMFKIDQVRHREMEPADPEQMARFQAALEKYQREAPAERAKEAARKKAELLRLAQEEERRSGLPPGDAWEAPEPEGCDFPVPPPAEG